MKSYVEKEKLIVCLKGRIDSNNALDVEAEILNAVEEHPGLPLCIDAGELQYLSSAGLRILLRLSKKQEAPLTVRNVSLEVYEILDTTGFTTFLDVQKRKRELSLDGCEIIGEGAFGTVYRLDEDTVVKMYRNPELLPLIESEQDKARKAFLQGIPTAIPFDIITAGGQYGSVFEMVKAKNGNQLLLEEPERFPEIIRMYAEFLKSMHEVSLKAGDLPDARGNFLRFLDTVLPELPEHIAARLRELLLAMPENLHVVHGDVHLKNIMYSEDSLMLIDMDTLCLGDPVFDFAGLYATYVLFNEDEPDNSLKFYGIDRETAARIFHETLVCYLGEPDADTLRRAEEKILVAGALRFLYIVAADRCRNTPELKRMRIRSSVRHLEEGLPRIDSLEL